MMTRGEGSLGHERNRDEEKCFVKLLKKMCLKQNSRNKFQKCSGNRDNKTEKE